MSDDPLSRSILLEELLDHGAIAFESRSSVPPQSLHPDEAVAVTRAVPKRLEEFATGRACARRALERLGITQYPLRVGADREPLWPAGIAGSITHTRGFCAAAVARCAECASLGIDAEPSDSVHARLWRTIATEAELAQLAGLPERAAWERATLLFSAKESFFKCQYPLTRQWLNFRDVSVSIEAHTYRIEPQRRIALEPRAPAPWVGRHALREGLVITAMSLPGPALRPSNA
ncbi:MAG TPA: 4'-phosphopantetheinyl transferase superfamily protein [Steroidobacteraceae bacterium]|nr:4'-phosphopantetheinyl transferase superfamily protein [Steroidobacteraceae bacterium]